MDRALARLDAVLEDYRRAQALPGLAAGVWRGGGPVYMRAHGLAGLDTQKPLTTGTLFHMASVSKTFVATAVMQLCEAGKLDTDESLAYYLPGFRARGPYQRITLKHMLNHTSGLTYTDDAHWGEGPYDDGALARYVDSLDDLELMWDPGEQFYYNNTLYEVLGHLVALASGMSFEEYVKTRILQPLGMEQSTFMHQQADPALLASPHILAGGSAGPVKVSGVYPYNRMHAPSSTLHSSVEEMMRFGQAYLGRGATPGGRLFSEESYLQMSTPTVGFVRAGRPGQLGLTWFIHHHRGYTVLSHSGSDPGFNTKISLIPERDIFTVVLCNGDYAYTDALEAALLDAALGEEPPLMRFFPYNEALKGGGRNCVSGSAKFLEQVRARPDIYSIREVDYLRLSDAWLAAEEPQRAAGVLRAGLREFPASADLHHALADCHAALDELLRARLHYEKAFVLNPGDVDAKKALAAMGRRTS